MPAPKTKSAPASGPTKGNDASSASTNGTTTPVSTEKRDTSEPTVLPSTGSVRPDKKEFDAEQERVKTEIDALQVKLSAVRDKISLATKSGPGNDRRTTLRAELDSIRGQQSGNKASRGKILDQVKAIQDGIQKKIQDLQAARTKIPFKTVADVDAYIKNLEKQVESGNMKLADEKRALQEITQCKRNRRAVESFQADQESIEADRHTVDELRKQLDDPESKAISDRYEAIKAELDQLKREGDEAYAGRSKLFEERDNLQAELNALYNARRDSSHRFREANDRYWNKVNEDRARRAEKARVQRAAEEAQKKQEIADRLREEAEIPAFQAQIEDCQTLIDYLSGKNSGNVTFKSAPVPAKADVAGVPKLELRQVEAAPADGLVVRKKKGEEESAYFVGGKGKGKGKKGSTKPSTPDGNGAATTSSSATNMQLNVPLPTLSALLSLSIPPPVSTTDVPRVIEDLKTKKSWFEANQARVTQENISKAEADIKRITNAAKSDAKVEDSPSSSNITPPNGEAERPAEPTSTPVVGDLPSGAVPSEQVVDELEAIHEQEVAQES